MFWSKRLVLDWFLEVTQMLWCSCFCMVTVAYTIESYVGVPLFKAISAIIIMLHVNESG